MVATPDDRVRQLFALDLHQPRERTRLLTDGVDDGDLVVAVVVAIEPFNETSDWFAVPDRSVVRVTQIGVSRHGCGSMGGLRAMNGLLGRAMGL